MHVDTGAKIFDIFLYVTYTYEHIRTLITLTHMLTTCFALMQ